MESYERSMNLRRSLRKAVAVPRVVELLARADALRCLKGWDVNLEEEERRKSERVTGMLDTPRRRITVTLTRSRTRSRVFVHLRCDARFVAKGTALRWRKKCVVSDKDGALWFSVSAFFRRVHNAAVEQDLRVFDQLAEDEIEKRALSP